MKYNMDAIIKYWLLNAYIHNNPNIKDNVVR